jgi:hypothetical protein
MVWNNLTPEKGRLEKTDNDYYYYFNPAKTLKASVEIVTDATKARVSVGCPSCTIADIKKTEKGFRITFEYKSKDKGYFNRTVNFIPQTDGKETIYKLKITGSLL